jgi:hypothetical protein
VSKFEIAPRGFSMLFNSAIFLFLSVPIPLLAYCTSGARQKQFTPNTAKEGDGNDLPVQVI